MTKYKMDAELTGWLIPKGGEAPRDVFTFQIQGTPEQIKKVCNHLSEKYEVIDRYANE